MGYVYKFVHKETGKYYIGSHHKPSAGSWIYLNGLDKWFKKRLTLPTRWDIMVSQ